MSEIDEGLVAWPGLLPGPLPESAPARRPGWLRRTSHLDTVRGNFDSPRPSPAEVSGSARDLLTTDTGAEVLGVAALTITLRDGRIAAVGQSPESPSCASLVGLSTGFGFRSQARAVLEATTGSLLGLLVDDLSGSSAASGYLTMRERMLDGGPPMTFPAAAAPPPGGQPAQTGVCAGWRAGGLAIGRQRSGEVPYELAPIAPSIDVADDPLAWHDLGPTPVGRTRRLRRLDLGRHDGHLAVDAMFRDSVVEPGGIERVVHEYALVAALDADSLEILSITADPRALPYSTDCPFAAASATQLVGRTVHDLRRSVAKLLAPEESCTHLNDLLRSLADITGLVAHLPPT